jgi:hypothetical protein
MRRIKDITIKEPEGSRDIGKTFRIKEMDADRGEAWAIRAILSLTNSGVDMEGVSGWAGIAQAGFQGLGRLKYEDAKPLLDEMFECITFVPDPKRSQAVERALVLDDIEEVATRLLLRAEVFKLHVGFSLPGNPLKGSTSGSKPGPRSSRGQTSQRQSP